jgi:hypothetical protein
MRTPDQAAAAWAAGLANASQKITDGVNGVTVAPGQLAARQVAVYTQNVAASAPKWAKNVAAVPLATWQQDVITKGIPRIATGAAAAQPKFSAFMGKLLPFIASQKSSLPPRGTFDQNLARMAAWARAMHGFSK